MIVRSIRMIIVIDSPNGFEPLIGGWMFPGPSFQKKSPIGIYALDLELKILGSKQTMVAAGTEDRGLTYIKQESRGAYQGDFMRVWNEAHEYHWISEEWVTRRPQIQVSSFRSTIR